MLAAIIFVAIALSMATGIVLILSFQLQSNCLYNKMQIDVSNRYIPICVSFWKMEYRN